MTKILVPLILAAIFFTACAKEDSPEAALREIILALAERDSVKLADRADLDAFFAATYDATTVELAKRYETYKAAYPDDPYFQRDAEFLTTYNAEQRARHLEFLRGVEASYFAKVSAPSAPQDDPTAYVANEFDRLRRATNATIKETRISDDRATVVLDVHGDDSLSGRFIGQLTFELGFRRNAQRRWQFVSIENLDELTPALVDRAELIWVTL